MFLRLGVFLITLSGLTFEIGLTRIFSATIWYHFAFVAVSVALLGWGLGGFALQLLRRRRPPSLDLAATLSLLYALAIPTCLWLILRLPLSQGLLPVYAAASVLPFLLAGMALSAVFDLHHETAGRLYFADLLGAAAGAVAVTPLLSWLGGESTVVAVAIAPALASACFSRRLRTAAVVVAVVLIAAAGFNPLTGLFAIRGGTKAMHQHLAATPGARVALTGWNSYSRIDAVEGFPPPYLARLYIDSDAWTNVNAWDGDVASAVAMKAWYRALPFTLVNRPRTLVIGPGGGADVVVALAAGSERVTAVEMNPLMVRFVRNYGARAGNLYDHPRVEVRLSEGRNFISRSREKYDVIFLGFVDSWASVASGGLSLSENYLYTVEAFRAYFDHLTDDGLLVILRWDSDVPRLVANSVALLGAEAAAGRMVAVLERRGTPDEPPQMIFILRRRPFTAEEAARIMDDWALARPVLVPGRHADPPYDALLSGRQSLAEYAAASPTRADAVFDDSPFYFATIKPWGLHPDTLAAFRVMTVAAAVLCLVFVGLGKPRGAPVGPYASSIVYFASLGVGFITVELALLQHLTLLLGHPLFTLSILLAGLLASGGLGSAASARFGVRGVCLTVAALGMLYALVLPRAVQALLPLPLGARIAVALALVAPLGFAMGMPFPRGLRRAGRGGLPAPPFYWGLNGVLSVIGSIATVLVSVLAGFRTAMIAGSACYALAAAVGGFVGQGPVGPDRRP
jgi:hypothetical protein